MSTIFAVAGFFDFLHLTARFAVPLCSQGGPAQATGLAPESRGHLTTLRLEIWGGVLVEARRGCRIHLPICVLRTGRCRASDEIPNCLRPSTERDGEQKFCLAGAHGASLETAERLVCGNE